MKLIASISILLFTIHSNAGPSDKVIAGTIANSCFLQGEIVDTGRAFDIGISGEGWIPLKGIDGALFYSRYGVLGMDREGNLVHVPSGLPVVRIESSGEAQKINIAQKVSRPFYGDKNGRQAKLISMFFTEEGALEGIYNDGQSAQITKITLAVFENPSRLELTDSNKHLFSAPNSVGEVAYGHATTAPFGKIFARALEEVPADRYSKKCD